MSPPRTDWRNGWAERIDALRQFAQNPGGVAVLVLIFFLGLIAGWIPSPITSIAKNLQEHDARVIALTTARSVTDARLVDILVRLTAEVERQNKRARIIECAAVHDRELQRRCLE